MVVKCGQNERDVAAMARHFKGSPYVLRFMEFMDVGTSNGWKMGEVVPSAEVIGRINAEMALPGWWWRDQCDLQVTQSFCHSCTRVRISTEGKLFTSLFATNGHDLRAPYARRVLGRATVDRNGPAQDSTDMDRPDSRRSGLSP